MFLDDLVQGIVRVIERAKPGERYLMTGESATTAEVVEQVCTLGKARQPRFALPVPAARLLMLALMPIEFVSGRRLPFNNQQLKSLARHWNFDDSKARRDLDWAPRGLDEGLPPTVEFLLGTIGRRG